MVQQRHGKLKYTTYVEMFIRRNISYLTGEPCGYNTSEEHCRNRILSAHLLLKGVTMKREAHTIAINKDIVKQLQVEVVKMRPRCNLNAFIEFLIEEFLESKKLKLQKEKN